MSNPLNSTVMAVVSSGSGKLLLAMQLSFKNSETSIDTSNGGRIAFEVRRRFPSVVFRLASKASIISASMAYSLYSCSMCGKLAQRQFYSLRMNVLSFPRVWHCENGDQSCPEIRNFTGPLTDFLLLSLTHAKHEECQ